MVIIIQSTVFKMLVSAPQIKWCIRNLQGYMFPQTRPELLLEKGL